MKKQPKYVIRRTHNNKGYYFVLKASNSKVIATSEVYNSKQSARKGINSIRKNAADAEVYYE